MNALGGNPLIVKVVGWSPVGTWNSTQLARVTLAVPALSSGTREASPWSTGPVNVPLMLRLPTVVKLIPVLLATMPGASIVPPLVFVIV